MWDIENYKKYMFAEYPAYRLDCVVMEAVENILNGFPEFAEYFAICHKQEEFEKKANYKRGQKLVQREKELLAKDDPLIIEELLICASREDALGEARWGFVKKYGDDIKSFFLLHMAAMSSKVEIDNQFACFFGIRDEKPSPEFLKYAEAYIVPSKNQACSWSPFLFHELFKRMGLLQNFYFATDPSYFYIPLGLTLQYLG